MPANLQPEPHKAPTLSEVAHFLSYDADRGQFTWVRHAGRVTKGAVAGTAHSKGYLRIKLSGRRYFAHRLAWFVTTGEWPTSEIDHINGNRADNRIANLRLATSSQNHLNTSVHADNRSGFKGVSKHSRGGKWQAQICIGGSRQYLGLFDTPQQAHAAYVEAAELHAGEFASDGRRAA